MSRKSWDSFEKLYARVETTDPRTGKKNVRYEYQGSWHVLASGEKTLRLTKWICGAALAADALCLGWAGTRTSAFNLLGWTSLPVGLALAAWVFITCGVFPLLFSGKKWKSPDHDRASLFLRTATLAEAGLMAFVFLYGMGWKWLGGHPEESALPLVGYLGAGLCAMMIRQSFGKLEYRVEKQDSGRTGAAGTADTATPEKPDPMAIFRREEKGE
ncbi:MAG: hypothetical protein IJ188_04795 [Clostridia bacterium]|nr:hypothetical protein [Clostridia bacterium]